MERQGEASRVSLFFFGGLARQKDGKDGKRTREETKNNKVSGLQEREPPRIICGVGSRDCYSLGREKDEEIVGILMTKHYIDDIGEN
jgi:hypothetical protein